MVEVAQEEDKVVVEGVNVAGEGGKVVGEVGKVALVVNQVGRNGNMQSTNECAGCC